ncbi:MAG: hypothetical protein KDG58_04450, partial [Anaerolineae bacterium]|nr:hypothetical protein [Anaerolineae bacterium]
FPAGNAAGLGIIDSSCYAPVRNVQLAEFPLHVSVHGAALLVLMHLPAPAHPVQPATLAGCRRTPAAQPPHPR